MKLPEKDEQRRKGYEAQHRAIVEALRDRDAEHAGQALTGHLRRIQHTLFALSALSWNEFAVSKLLIEHSNNKAFPD